MILLIPLNGVVAMKMRMFQVGAGGLCCSCLEPWPGAWGRVVPSLGRLNYLLLAPRGSQLLASRNQPLSHTLARSSLTPLRGF